MFATDDGTAEIQLQFSFTLYGTTYPAGTTVYVNNNGNISFGEAYPTFTSTGFPLPNVQMIAPFWADVDSRKRGILWYKSDPDKFVAIWDRMPRYNDPDNDDVLNTFQLILSNDKSVLDGRGNICFCYIDMDWTTGNASGGSNGFGGTAATVGVNGGDGVNYVQFGRFSMPGTFFDGGGGFEDGVDYLDNRKGGDDGAICLDATTANVVPVVTGFPTFRQRVTCLGTVRYVLTFTSPELDQTVTVTRPTNLPQGATINTIRDDGVTIILEFEWTPNEFQAGSYEFAFTATDNLGASISDTLMLLVADCSNDGYCVPIAQDDTCDVFDPRPFCTPFRSVEFCPADESFPTQISTRNDAVQDDPVSVENAGYWFHNLDDKVGGYVFSSVKNVNAAKLYCCVDNVDELMSTCFPNGHNLNSFVVRANGHSLGRGIFAFPDGFGDLELLRQISMTGADVVAEIKTLRPMPDKIIVEEFLPGDTGLTSLPVEYKFHVFNGEIASITAIYNRAGTCACIAEFDQDFNRLDQFGCFEPGEPFDQDDRTCHRIDFQAGSQQLTQIKNLDICTDPLPPIEPCVWNDLTATAIRLSRDIGVYMRIDMFVSNNVVYVQEYSSNHNNGRHHCSAKQDPDNLCIDSCFLGREWKDAGGSTLYGGPRTNPPSQLNGWRQLEGDVQCTVALGVSPNNPPQTTC